MKKKITALLLVAVMLFCTLSLSSCLMLTLGDDGDDGNNGVTGDATINVTGGDSYDITIDSPPTVNVAAANKSLLSAVSVVAFYEQYNAGWGGFGGSQSSSVTHASGSGVIYKLDKENGHAYIITNHHVVYDSTSGISDEIKIFLYGQETDACAIDATYVGGSMYYDIAVLKVTNSTVLMESIASEAVFADSDEISVLDTVIAVGNAEGNGISATVGYINVDSEYITMTGADEKTEISLRVMRTDAAVNPGNSGGGLFNTKGEVVGIVNAKSADDSIDNIGFAIPSNVAKSIAENIIDYCEGTNKTCVYRCILGITVRSQNPYAEYDVETGKLYKREEVAIESVNAGTAAAEVLQQNDIIKAITIDGETCEVTRQYHVIDCMLDAREGSTIVFTIIRDGVETTATITATADMLEAYK